MSDQAAMAMVYALLIALPVSALVARRLPLATAAKYALAWVAIFAIGMLLVLLYRDLTGVAP